MKLKRGDISFAMFYFFFFGGQSCLASYLLVYFEQELGFTGSQIGLYNALTLLVPALLIPTLGYRADRSGRHMAFFVAAMAVQLAGNILLGLQSRFVLVLLFGVLMGAARNFSSPLADTLTTNYCAEANSNFGTLRTWGSVGWVVAGMLLGFAVENTSSWSLLFVVSCGMTGLALLSGVLFRRTEGVPSEERAGRAGLMKLLKSRSYWLILFMAIEMSIASDTIVSYANIHLTGALGAGADSISWNTAFCVVPEIVMMPLMSRLTARHGYRRMYVFSCLLVIARCVIYIVAQSAPVFLIGSLLQGITACCCIEVNLALIRETVEPGLLGTAVTAVSSVTAVGKAAFSYICGLLHQNMGSRSIFVAILIINLPLLVVLLRTKLLDRRESC